MMETKEDLAGLHWSALKSRVEAAGGKYVGKDEAIAFLTASPENAEETAQDAGEPQGDGVVRFNPKKPHGTVHGEVEGAPNARYWQDGHYFNAAGEQVG
jgi:hypothetical protein